MHGESKVQWGPDPRRAHASGPAALRCDLPEHLLSGVLGQIWLGVLPASDRSAKSRQRRHCSTPTHRLDQPWTPPLRRSLVTPAPVNRMTRAESAVLYSLRMRARPPPPPLNAPQIDCELRCERHLTTGLGREVARRRSLADQKWFKLRDRFLRRCPSRILHCKLSIPMTGRTGMCPAPPTKSPQPPATRRNLLQYRYFEKSEFFLISGVFCNLLNIG